MLKAKVFLIALIFGCVKPVFAQSDYLGFIDFQIRNFGYDFGFGIQRPSPLEHLQKGIGLRIGSINHPKEVFVINQVLPASEPFIMDKVARVWAVKPYRSWRWAVAKHRSRFDVGVELYGAVKLPLAYSWPIYVWTQDIRRPFDGYTAVRYNPDLHPPENIGGEVSYTRGFREGQWIPGIGTTVGLSLNWGSYRNWENRLSVGYTQDLFVKELPLMHSIGRNPQFLPAVFLNFAIVFGK